MNILVENKLGEYQNRVDYVVDFINTHPVCPKDVNLVSDILNPNLKIQYGGQPIANTHYIPRQQIIFSEKIIQTKTLFANEYHWNDMTLYSVELADKNTEKFKIDAVFQFDIIESIFFHLSRYEEYHCESSGKDRWDMMLESDQFLVRNNIEKIPIVDHLVICFLDGIGVKPLQKKTEVRITHDIDLIEKFKSPLSFLRFNAHYLKNKRGIKAIKNLWLSYFDSVFQNKMPYDVFDEMLIEKDIEREIYFLVGGITSVDTPLNTESEIFKKAITISKERGYKIGIHPSYSTWKDGSMLKYEKEFLESIIGNEITISRQHYLHFAFDKTISLLEEAGIKQDSTIGFNRRVGFRAGTGVGFYLFDLQKDKASNILEKPLAFMDSSLFEESNFKALRFTEIANNFIEENHIGTELTCNFHNSRFDDAKMYNLPQDELYAKLINV